MFIGKDDPREDGYGTTADGPIPWLAEFRLCQEFHWSFDEARNLPLLVREMFLLILDSQRRGAEWIAANGA